VGGASVATRPVACCAVLTSVLTLPAGRGTASGHLRLRFGTAGRRAGGWSMSAIGHGAESGLTRCSGSSKRHQWKRDSKFSPTCEPRLAPGTFASPISWGARRLALAIACVPPLAA